MSKAPNTPKRPRSWRDRLPIHPAAELFPLMSSDELRELGEDIKNNGLTSPFAVFVDSDGTISLLDGRNRLDAMKLVGVRFAVVLKGPWRCTLTVAKKWRKSAPEVRFVRDDPYGYVVSANIRRRHLSIEDKDRLIAKLLKADPTKSNRQVAKLTNTSHPHVAKVRGQAEKTGDVETVTTSVDSKGRRQPAHKQPVLHVNARNDVGSDSSGENERLRSRVAELEAAVRQRDLIIADLRRRIAELERTSTAAQSGANANIDQ